MNVKDLFSDNNGSLSDYGEVLTCPECGSENVHFYRPEYSEIEYESWEGRGNAIRIPMKCEGFHKWVLRLGHHKGTSFGSIKQFGDTDSL